MPLPLLAWAAIAAGTAIAGAVAVKSTRSSSGSSSPESSVREAEIYEQQRAEEERNARQRQRHEQQRQQFIFTQLQFFLDDYALNAVVPKNISSSRIEQFLDIELENMDDVHDALAVLCAQAVHIKPLSNKLSQLEKEAEELKNIAQLLQEI